MFKILKNKQVDIINEERNLHVGVAWVSMVQTETTKDPKVDIMLIKSIGKAPSTTSIRTRMKPMAQGPGILYGLRTVERPLPHKGHLFKTGVFENQLSVTQRKEVNFI